MRFDIIVYGRGQEVKAGFQTFAAPPYWTENMLMSMGQFNDLWTNREFVEAYNSPNSNPWGKTYMIISMPPPYCCVLLRITRAEGDEPGTWLKEARNFDIWSMEGLCCPYESCSSFMAMLPSMILWMEKNNSSLYNRIRLNKTGSQVDIPELIDPYSDTPPSEELLSCFSTETEKNAFIELTNKIYLSAKPIQLLFGPLANEYSKRIGKFYGIEDAICSTEERNYSYDKSADPFSGIKHICLSNPVPEKRKYDLHLRTVMEKGKQPKRRWELMEERIGTPPEVRYYSKWYDLNESKSIDVPIIRAEAMAICEFAKRMNWEQLGSSKHSVTYSFIKEE